MSDTPKKSIETPLAEITLRRYEKPYNLNKREITQKVCLSLGLLQPGDTRDIIVDILYVMLESRKDKQELSSFDVKERVVAHRRECNLDLKGIADSNIRRQLKRLRDIFIVEKVKNNYRVTEYETLSRIFEEKVEQYLLASIVNRVKEYLSAADKTFEPK